MDVSCLLRSPESHSLRLGKVQLAAIPKLVEQVEYYRDRRTKGNLRVKEFAVQRICEHRGWHGLVRMHTSVLERH